MKKCGISVLCILALLSAGCVWAAPSEKELKAMSVFVSNFTEQGIMEVVTEEMAQPDKYPDLVRFGIRHNYINNFKSRIEANREGAREHGDVRIKATWVEETVLKYFGLKIKADRSVEQIYPPYHFDGTSFHFQAADGEATWLARVKKASSPQKGVWEISGEVYNADDPADVLGGFNAVIRESVWKNKPHYVMVRLSAAAQ